MLNWNKGSKRIDFFPESFEWLVLKSSIFSGSTNVKAILADPVEYIESKEFFNWEHFFAYLLVEETKDNPLVRYLKDKNRLPAGYLSDTNVNHILNAMKDT